MKFQLEYKSYHDRAIIVEWPSKIDKYILRDIILFKAKIISDNDNNRQELRSAYNSLLIIYKESVHFKAEKEALIAIYSRVSTETSLNSRLWKIPVCYEEHFALDLQYISNAKELSTKAIIKKHSEVVYTVYFIGFLPGFLYLGGLDEDLEIPRKSTPRLKIEKGAVAIGGNQTGVYPIESPGGWNVIGNSPIQFFNAKNNPPCFAKTGDQIQFVPVKVNTYNKIKSQVENNTYIIESEMIYD